MIDTLFLPHLVQDKEVDNLETDYGDQCDEDCENTSETGDVAW
jgi:hypothetical protein